MRLPATFLCLCFLWLPSLAGAQELTPRAFWPAPTGTQVLTIGAVYTRGDMIPDPSLPITGIDSRISTGYLAYLRTLDLFGRSSNLIFELPYSSGDTTGQHLERGLVEREYQGVGDVAATLSINLMGAPAMDRDEDRWHSV